MQQDTQDTFRNKLSWLKNYLELSYIELKKVTWPTKKETKTTSIVVFVFVAVMSIFLSIVDFGLSKIVALILTA